MRRRSSLRVRLTLGCVALVVGLNAAVLALSWGLMDRHLERTVPAQYASDVADLVGRLAELSVAKRRALPGVSPERAGQLLAGALVADAAMELFGIEELEICPWALREGVILEQLDAMSLVNLSRS